jgi:hypothetical protein
LASFDYDFSLIGWRGSDKAVYFYSKSDDPLKTLFEHNLTTDEKKVIAQVSEQVFYYNVTGERFYKRNGILFSPDASQVAYNSKESHTTINISDLEGKNERTILDVFWDRTFTRKGRVLSCVVL